MRLLQKKMIALGILLLLGTIWGTGYSIARFAMTHGVTPLGYSFWQALGPAIFITVLAWVHQMKIPLSTHAIRYYLICGLTGIVIPNTTIYYSAKHLPAGLLAMIVNTVPIIAYPLALLVKLETFSWQRMFGIFLAVTGLAFIMLPPISSPDTDHTLWIFSTLLAPLSFAICSIYIARHQPNNGDVVVQSAGMLIAATCLLSPLVFQAHQFHPIQHPLQLPDSIILIEIILSSVGYLLFFYLIRIAGPVFYSLVDTIVVLTGVFWGIVIFDEKLHSFTLVAIVLIITALLLVTQQQNRINLPD